MLEGAIVYGIHGDEQNIRPLLHEKYNKVRKGNIRLRSVCGNPLAVEMNLRGVPEREKFDPDLNREFPGEHDSSSYVQRRAAELTDRLKGQNAYGVQAGFAHDPVDFVIDVHETYGNFDLIVVDGLNERSKALIQYFDIRHVVDLNRGKGDYHGFLISEIPGSIALEFGNMEDSDHPQQIRNRLQQSVDSLLNENPQYMYARPYYTVWGSLTREIYDRMWSATSHNIANFTPLTPEQKQALNVDRNTDLVPAFIGEYPDKVAQMLEMVGYIRPES